MMVDTSGRAGQHAVGFLEERKARRSADRDVAAGVMMVSDGNLAGEHM